MAEILIKGLKVKNYPQTITINPDGSVIKDTFGLHRLVEEWKAVKVPHHGRLVDIDRMISQARIDKFPIDIHSTEELADFLEIYADLDKTDHTIVIEASEGRKK